MSDTIIQTSEKTPAIIVDRVTKTFLKRNTHSLKEAFVGWTKGKKVRADVFHALDDVSFQIGEGESVAVLGFNGSGKSTTLKMVSGVMQPDQGRVFTKGRVAGLIEVGAGFHPDLSGRENVYLNAAILGMSKEQIDARFDDIVEFSEIGDFIEVAIHVDLDVLLVDEVLAVGDEAFRKKCSDKLKELAEQGVTMLIVSHSMGMVRDLCSRGIVIHEHKVLFDGPIEEAVQVIRNTPH
jgi:ABC-2 type transport system ATP-binding protein